MENVLVREEIVLIGEDAEVELLDFIEECESLGYEMFIEEKEDEDTFTTINNLFELWDWLGVNAEELENGLEVISVNYIAGDNEVTVKLKIDKEIKEFVIGVL